ncbi:BTAD domain-containing putative transcriptional regulator [Plantactinospora sp. B6F1]|uniref:AfsR/SARP family transcriptional regulator n=1 Tax=Plantactinospora sp. B6F1 TaxID=3158971 RepID=UPI0032D97488
MRFRVLGPMAAHNERGPVPLGPARQRTVLAVLLAERTATVSVDHLVDRVWGSAAPERARQILHTYLSRLRSVLTEAGGPTLTRQARSYRLAIDESAVDLHQFRALAARARQEADDERAEALWRDALALWRDVPFADLDNDWLRGVAVALEAERLAAMLDRNDLSLRRGDHARLLPDLSVAAGRHPLDERLAGQLMLAFYRCGRQTDALAGYRLLRERLADEFGSDPGPALRDLHQRILRQDPQLDVPPAADAPPAPVADAVPQRPEPTDQRECPAVVDPQTGAPEQPETPAAPVVAVPAQLPADIAGFAGRAAPLLQLDALLGPAGAPASTVVITAIGGSAGIGKTTLAVHWAHRIRDRFPDGQLYLNLRGFNPAGQAMSPPEALRALLELLQVPPQRIPTSVEAQTGLYRSRLAGRRMLVVLDNARDADQVRPLLPGSPPTMVLVTSRNQLAGLVATEGARPIRLDVLDAAEARGLLVGRLGAERVAAEPDAVDEIVRACAGLPLALAIVAARAAARPGFRLAVFADELADARSRLDALAGPDSATDVRAVFSWSYQALSPSAARLFRMFGLHPGPDISRGAAASLAGVPLSQVRRLLTELDAAHLLTEGQPGRYTCHDLLRAYATELGQDVDTEPERRAARHRTFDHYVHTAVAAAQLLNSYLKPIDIAPAQSGVTPVPLASYDDALRWFTDERPVLLAAIAEAANAGYDTHSWQLAWALRDLLERRCHWHAQLQIQQTALAAAERLGDPALQVNPHTILGVTYRHLGRYPDSHAHLQDALRLAGAVGDQRGQAGIHGALSLSYEREGRHLDGLRHTRRAMDLYRGLGDPIGHALHLGNLAYFQALLGDYQQSLVSSREALGPLEEHDHRNGQAHAWDSLGFAHHRLGQHREAIACYQRAVALFRSIDDRHPQAASLTCLADVHHATGDIDAARDAWQQAFLLLEEIGHPDADDLRKKLESADLGRSEPPGFRR